MDIQKSFDDTLKHTQIPEVGMDIAESSIDSIIQNDILKEMPIVRVFVGIIQAGVNIQDKLFLKKILAFLKGIEEFDEKKRNKIINKIDQSKKYRLKVGEKLLYIIDSCSDYESAELVSKLFAAFLRNEINYGQYIDASEIVTRISKKDLMDFLDAYSSAYLRIDDVSHLIHTGLLTVGFEEVEVDVSKDGPGDWDDPQDSYSADVNGGELLLSSSEVGDVVFKILANNDQQERYKDRHSSRKSQLSFL